MNTQEIIESIATGVFTENPLTEEVQKWIATDRTNQLRYIGLSGHIGSGKDYIANYIAKTVERKCEVVKFATKLNILVASILGVDDLSLFQDRTWKDKKQFVWNTPDINGDYNALRSARDIQKIVATIMRDINPDIWLDLLVKECTDHDTLYVISDLRYANEFQFVQQNNGIVVFIENLQAAQNQHRKEAGIVHESERLVWDMHYGNVLPDYILNNNNYSNKQPLQDLLTFISML